jgi:hypothetical protein
MGCTTLRLTPDKALVGVGDEVTVLVAPLDPQLAAPVNNAPKPVAAPAKTANPIPNPNPERSTAMKPPETNGSVQGRRDTPSEQPDPLTAAEELRDALSDVLTKATRLIAALRATRREKKVLATVFNGLKQLNLAPSNGRPT